MDALINSLQQNPPKASGIFVYDDVAEDEGNICTKSQVAAIREKGWTPYYVYAHNGNEKGRDEWTKAYEGMDDDNPASITLPELENSTVEIYNLAGQKVTAPQKGGIYIVGGKKVVVK